MKATALADVTRANVHKGKYAYMSPEQAEGRPLSAASDQFSLGVLLCELCVGARPFDGETPVATLDRIKAAEPPRLEGLGAGLAAIIRRCLAREAGERFPDAIALGRALRAARAGRGSLEELGAWVMEQLGGT